MRYERKRSKTNAQAVFNEFLELKRTTRKQSTYNRYNALYKIYIQQYLNSIEDINASTVSKILYNARQHNISESTVQAIYQLLHSYLQYCYKLRLITVNYCDFVDRPKRKRKQTNTLTIEQANKLLKYLYSKRTTQLKYYNLYIAIRTALETGIRRGELVGLTWDNIDLDNNIIKIRDSVVIEQGHTIITTTKTSESIRDIIISNRLKRELKEYKKQQIRTELQARKYKSTRNAMLKWADGTAVHPEYFTKQIKKLCEELELPKLRWHDLRHTNATLLYANGVDYKLIQTRLGHTDIQTTLNIYTHITTADQTRAVQTLEHILAQ